MSRPAAPIWGPFKNFKPLKNLKNLTHLGNVRLWGTLMLAAVLSGCAGLKSHDKLATEVQGTSHTAGVSAALAQLEASASSEEERAALLFNLERGELLRLERRYQDSTQAFTQADARVKEWEEAAQTDPSKLMGTVGAALVSERFKTFEGQDYEKVFLTTRLALNRMALGDWETARVDIKRTHEREAVIAEFRAKELAAAEEEAQSKGATKGGKDIDGYPVETLNDPEVLALKNGYSNALSHYLAGFLYEVLGESGLAAPGYRKAIELKPDTPILEDGLGSLDKRTGFTWKHRQRMTDVLFLVEAGDAPARKPKSFTLPIPTGRGAVAMSLSYPVIEPSKDEPLSRLGAAESEFKLEKIVDVNVMARRALKDEMPGMVLRGITRAIAKGVMQDQLQKKGGLLGALVGAVAAVATEQADDRMWRMLPGRIYIARGYLPPGQHQLRIDGRSLSAPVTIDGQYALVPLRLYGQRVLVGDVARIGALPAVAPEPPPVGTAAPSAVAPATLAPLPKKAKKAARKSPTTAPAAAQ